MPLVKEATIQLVAYFEENWNFIAVNLIKQSFDIYPKATEQMDFTGNLERAGNTTMFFITEDVKETILGLSQRTGKAL